MTLINIHLNETAHATIIAHSAKFSLHNVLGLLLSEKESDALEIVDAVPVLHCLTPVDLAALETSIELTGTFCAKKNLRIAGLYYIPSSSQGMSPTVNAIAQQLFVSLHKQSSAPLVVLMTNASPTLTYSSYHYDGQGLVAQAASAVSLPNDQDKIKKMIANKTYQQLYDFEMHLENIHLDVFSKDFHC